MDIMFLGSPQEFREFVDIISLFICLHKENRNIDMPNIFSHMSKEIYPKFALSSFYLRIFVSPGVFLFRTCAQSFIYRYTININVLHLSLKSIICLIA